MGGTAWGSPSAGGQRGITWEGDNLKTLGFCPGFTPTQRLELAAGGDHWSPWRGRIRPTAGLSAGEGGNRRRQDGSSFLAPQLSHPSRTRERGAQPRGLTQGSAPPEPAPAAAFSGLLVLISGCFLIKAIWGLRRAAESQDLLRINGKIFGGGGGWGLPSLPGPLGTDLSTRPVVGNSRGMRPNRRFLPALSSKGLSLQAEGF